MFTKLRNAYHNASQWAHHHTIVVCLGLFLFAVSIAWQALMPQGQAKAQYATLDCSAASNINVPEQECEALLDFYDSLDGPNRVINTGPGAEFWDTNTNICDRFGVDCTNILGQERVSHIRFLNNNLSGTLPASLSNLEYMKFFRIVDNGGVSGILHPEWSSRSGLISFELQGTKIGGSLPSEWETWTNLQHFKISQARLSGELPETRSSRSGIIHFQVNNTKISGSLPSSWSTWPNIKGFIVYGNHLTGSLPTSWSDRGDSIVSFDVKGNQIQGVLPNDWEVWNVRSFQIDGNNIVGPIPSGWIQNWPNSRNGNQSYSYQTSEGSVTLGISPYITVQNNCLDTLGYNTTEQDWISSHTHLTFEPQCTDITIDKQTEYVEGSLGIEVVYTINYTNNGPNPAQGVAIYDTPGAGLNLEQISGGYTIGSPIIMYGIPGDYCYDTLSTNTTGPYVDALNQAVSLYTTDFQEFLFNYLNAPYINDGNRGPWLANMINDDKGPGSVSLSQIMDMVGLSIENIDPSCGVQTHIINIGSVPLGGSETIIITGSITEQQGDIYNNTISNQVYITSNFNPDRNQINNQDAVYIPITEPYTDLSINKTIIDGGINGGSAITYAITYVNNGPGTATNAIIYDIPGTGLSILDTSIPYSSGTLTYGIIGDICAEDLLVNTAGPYADALNQRAINTGGFSSFPDFLYAILQDSVDTEEITEGQRSYRVSNRGEFVIEFIPQVAGSVENRFSELGIDIRTIDPSCGIIVNQKIYGGGGDMCVPEFAQNNTGHYADILNQRSVIVGPQIFPGATINNFPDIMYYFLQEDIDEGSMTELERDEAIANRGLFVVETIGPSQGGLTNWFESMDIIDQIDPLCGETDPRIYFSLGDVPAGSGGTIILTGTTNNTLDIIINTTDISTNSDDNIIQNNSYISSTDGWNYCGDMTTNSYYSNSTVGDIVDSSVVYIYHETGWSLTSGEATTIIGAELSGGQTAATYEWSLISQNDNNPISAYIVGSNTGETITIHTTGLSAFDYDVHPANAYILSVTITTTSGQQVSNYAFSIGGIAIIYLMPIVEILTGSTVQYSDYILFFSAHKGEEYDLEVASIFDPAFFEGQGSISAIMDWIGYDIYNDGSIDIQLPLAESTLTTIEHHYTAFTGDSFVTQVGRQPAWDLLLTGLELNQEYTSVGILFTTTETVLGTYIQEQCDGEEFCSPQCTIIDIPEPFCGDGEINQESEQCDDGPNGSDSCNTSCETIYTNPPTTYTCTLTANPSSGNRPLASIFTLNMSGSDIVPAYTSYIVYGDGTTGTSLQHTYNNANTYTAVGHIIFENEDITPISCNTTITVTQPGCVNCGGGETPTTNNSPTHQSAPEIKPIAGRSCIYNDEDYLARGPFTDTFGHRGFDYMDIMRISCLHRGRGVNKGLWIYEPNANITRAEVIKTVVKILGAEFEDFSIINERMIYTGSIPFVDVKNTNRFAHYANYAYSKGLVEGLFTIDTRGNRYIDPDQIITRYEAIKIIMLAYQAINKQNVSLNTTSVLGDVIDQNSPYYRYIRDAEILGFISGVPQKNGGYNFEGQRHITRAEFAKIASVPFADQLFDVEDIVANSNIYKTIIQNLNKTTGNKETILNVTLAELMETDSINFLKEFMIEKSVFVQALHKLISEQLKQ